MVTYNQGLLENVYCYSLFIIKVTMLIVSEICEIDSSENLCKCEFPTTWFNSQFQMRGLAIMS